MDEGEGKDREHNCEHICARLLMETNMENPSENLFNTAPLHHVFGLQYFSITYPNLRKELHY